MNRADLQQLADVRIDEAGVLLDQGRFDGAYYLAGYAVECALKACIAKSINQHDFPDKQLAQKCHTHDIEALVRLANLEAERDADNLTNAVLLRNWETVKVWNELSRYHRKTQAEAQELYDAITDATNGVLPWVKIRW